MGILGPCPLGFKMQPATNFLVASRPPSQTGSAHSNSPLNREIATFKGHFQHLVTVRFS